MKRVIIAEQKNVAEIKRKQALKELYERQEEIFTYKKLIRDLSR